MCVCVCVSLICVRYSMYVFMCVFSYRIPGTKGLTTLNSSRPKEYKSSYLYVINILQNFQKIFHHTYLQEVRSICFRIKLRGCRGELIETNVKVENVHFLKIKYFKFFFKISVFEKKEIRNRKDPWRRKKKIRDWKDPWR